MGCTSRKIVLLGKGGDGKSSAGNTILGENVFTTKASASNAGVKCQKAERKVHGRKITVIETPGDFDTDSEDEALKSETIKCLVDCAPGVEAFIIVLKVGRYTGHENEVIQKLLNTFSEEHVLKHTVILFTHGEQLEGKTVEEFMEDCPQLKKLVDKCGGRCHVIDNKYWNKRKRGYKSNRVQVKNLLKTIDEMVKESGCYTNEALQKLEEEIQEEIKKNKNNLPPEEKREKTKEIVHKKFWLQVAGASTGLLIGALLGVVVAVAAVLTLLKSFRSACKLLKAARGAEAAVEAVAAGGAAVEAVAAVETGAAAGGGGAAAGAEVGVVKVVAVGVVGVAALGGAVGGGVTGWKAAEEADSVYDAMTKAAKLNYENATVAVEKVQELVALAFNNKLGK